MALEPITRQEKIIAGHDLTPITRMEMFLKNFGGGGGGGSGVFEVFEATTNDRATLATGPSLEDIAGCYSRGKIPIIKLTVSDEEILYEFICTTGARLYTSDIPIGSLTFDCVYLDSVGSADGIWAAISIMYRIDGETVIRTGQFAQYGT